jgi:ABC-2 type transport system permease protein
VGYFVGLLAHCIVVSVVDVTLIAGVGRLFGAPLPTHWAAIAAALVLGAACFCALGVAVASLIRNAEAAPAVVQLVLFPLLFISGTYLPIHSSMLDRVAGLLPVRPFNQALLGPFAHHTGSPGTAWACWPGGAPPAHWWPSAASAGTPGRSDARHYRGASAGVREEGR